ncbi:MAG: prepilin-type N-terminal cleavage/methylation domain-containing protein [Gemmatimonadales bacterium]
MRTLKCCGFSLVELLLVIVVAGILAALVTTVVVASARSAQRQTLALEEQRSLAAVAAWSRADLRDGEPGDIAVPAPDRLVAHHPVGAGAPCKVSGAELWVGRSSWRGTRDPEPGRDELWLLTSAITPAWDEPPFIAIGASTCPDGSAALHLTLGVAVAPVMLVRAVEPVQLRLYRSGSRWWFGMAPADGSTPVQPIAGPFDPAGSRFAMDSGGVHIFVQAATGRAAEFFAPLPPP